MTDTLYLNGYQAKAARAGALREIRLPAADPAPAPGTIVELVSKELHGRTLRVGRAHIVSVNQQRLEQITDDQILLSGFPNWTVFSFEWNQRYAAGGHPWDTNPEVSVITLERTS